MSSKQILFFGRHGCIYSEKCLAVLVSTGFEVVTVWSHYRGEPLPKSALNWRGDYILCFRSLFLLPPKLLDNAKFKAVNFHPAPPNYRGSGCFNFALYEGSTTYGVTAHVMEASIDSGPIIGSKDFEITPETNLETLITTTHKLLFAQFCEFVEGLNEEGIHYLNKCRERHKDKKWLGRARKIQELDSLQKVELTVSEKELKNVVRATHSAAFPVTVSIHGFRFVLESQVKV